jgi:hypothetical protein
MAFNFGRFLRNSINPLTPFKAMRNTIQHGGGAKGFLKNSFTGGIPEIIRQNSDGGEEAPVDWKGMQDKTGVDPDQFEKSSSGKAAFMEALKAGAGGAPGGGGETGGRAMASPSMGSGAQFGGGIAGGPQPGISGAMTSGGSFGAASPTPAAKPFDYEAAKAMRGTSGWTDSLAKQVQEAVNARRMAKG